jgi:3D (Asp-Asp-Asp) domain-containing protein
MNWQAGGLLTVIAALGFSCGLQTNSYMEAQAALESTKRNAKQEIACLETECDYYRTQLAALSRQYSKQLTVTAYSPDPSETDGTPTVTASMTRVRHGIVAVSRDLFRQGWTFGKKVYVEGYGVFTIRDLMNRRYTNRLDVFRWDRREALKFGKQTLHVSLIVEGS